MRKSLNRKLTLRRESLHQLEPPHLTTAKGGLSELCSRTCLACTHSCRVPTCTC